MVKEYRVLKPFKNTGGRLLPVGAVGFYDEADAKPLIEAGNLEPWDNIRRGEVEGEMFQRLRNERKAEIARMRQAEKTKTAEPAKPKQEKVNQ